MPEEPMAPLGTFGMFHCDVLALLLVAALTPVVHTTAHNDMSMIVAMAILMMLRWCFITTIHLLLDARIVRSNTFTYAFTT
jgi:hypothetical protein